MKGAGKRLTVGGLDARVAIDAQVIALEVENFNKIIRAAVSRRERTAKTRGGPAREGRRGSVCVGF
jgi:hypothetical protein